jgi:hypothetical protein
MENLDKVCGYSFPANHLLTFTLMHDLKNIGSVKSEYFLFVALAPGATIENENSRTYDFSKIVNLKYSVHEIGGLSFALKQYAIGNGKHINYSKMSKSNNNFKTLVLRESEKEVSLKSGSLKVKYVNYQITSNSNTQSVSLTLDQAHALGEILDAMFRKAVELELFNKTFNKRPTTTNKEEPSFSGFGGFSV